MVRKEKKIFFTRTMTEHFDKNPSLEVLRYKTLSQALQDAIQLNQFTQIA